MNSKNSTKTKCRKCKGTGFVVRRKSGYKKGRKFEYDIIHRLKSNGWETHRSYASKGIFDIIAKHPKYPTMGIQAKNIKQGDYLKPEEKTRLEGYFGNKVDYEMNEWDMSKHSVRTINVGPIASILHVFREKGRLKTTWRKFDGVKWVTINNNLWTDI